MAVNLSFNANDEDFTTRGTIDQHSAVSAVLAKALPEEFTSPFAPNHRHPRRCSDGTVKDDSTSSRAITTRNAIAASLVHKNVSYPLLHDHSTVSNQLHSTTSLFQQNKVLINKGSFNSASNKRDGTESTFSDSEITVKLTSVENRLKLNNSFSGNAEACLPRYFHPSVLTESNNENRCNSSQCGPCSGVTFSASKQNPCHPTINPFTDTEIKSRPRHRPSEAILLDPTPPQSHFKALSSPFGPRQQRVAPPETAFSARKVSDSFLSPVKSSDLASRDPELESSREVKRSKSLLSKTSSLHKQSPLPTRRKSPYKELSTPGSGSEPKKLLSVQSPSISSTATSRLSGATSDSHSPASSLKHKRHKSLQSKQETEPRKPRTSGGWMPVQDMMTNRQYESHHHDGSSEENGNYQGGHSETNGSRFPRMKSFDAVVFDVLKIPPEEYARQLTLLDFPIFCAIRPDEITSCGWTKKDKWKISPNVCAMSQRFNHTSFWVIREILNTSTLKIRAEILTHFIKIAKRLYELNNLHSLMAIIQSLNSSSIFRLNKTWGMVQKHHKALFDKLLYLVKEDDNRWALRAHMDGIKLPCIPFLGMYLADVMFIDSAHPDTGGLESQERSNKMNNILRVIAEFQQSRYDHLKEVPHIKNYLNSVKYIEELQKFLEEDNYKLSLKIEPNQSSNSLTTPEKKPSRTKGDVDTGKSSGKMDRSALNRHNCHTPPVQHKFVPGHRKSHSLGKEFAFNSTVAMRPKSESSKIQKRRSMYTGSRQRDSTVWYISPTRGSMSPDSLSPSGSLPRGAAPSTVAVTTSLLDDSIIATPSSLASSSSSTNRMSVTGANSGSIGSSRSNSGSEFSEQDEMSLTSDRYSRHFSLPHKKSKVPTKWYKVYHGNRGKYSLRAAKAQVDRRKSCTYPIAKNSDLKEIYQTFVTSRGLANDTGEASVSAGSSSSTLVSDIDEFAKMRCKTGDEHGRGKVSGGPGTAGDVINCDVVDERARLISLESVSKKKKNNKQWRAVEDYWDIRGAQSTVTVGCSKGLGGCSDNAQYLRQFFVSPRVSVSQQVTKRSKIKWKRDKTALEETSYAVDSSTGLSERLVDGVSSSTSSDFNLRTLDISSDDYQTCKFEGYLKRKCVLKHGKKPTVSPWTKYWICVCDTKLVYFAAKTIRGHERHHFKSRPCKAVSVRGWMVLYSNDPARLDCFQLNNTESGNMYRFQCDSKEVALVWISVLQEATKGCPQAYVQVSRGVRCSNAHQGQLSIQRLLMDGLLLRQQSFNKRKLHSVNLGDRTCVSASKPPQVSETAGIKLHKKACSVRG